MAAGGLLTGGPGVPSPYPQIALTLNALADAAVCLLLIRMGKRLGFGFAGYGSGLAWAVAPFSVTFAIGGLETSVYVLLLCGAAACHIERRRSLTALLGAMALLTRPDALILVGLLILDRFWELAKLRREGQFRFGELIPELVSFGAPTLAWFLFATGYFGSVIPHSVAAKTLAYQLRPEEGLVRLLQHYSTPFMEHLTFGTAWIGIGMALHPFLFLAGALKSLRVDPRSWPLAAYPWLYFAVFALANPLIFRWYLTLRSRFYYLFILGGVEAVVLSLLKALSFRGWLKGSAITQAALVCCVILVPFLLCLQDWRLHPDHGIDRPAPEMAWYRLELFYRQAADEITAVARGPDKGTFKLAAGDVGVLGYYSGMQIVDTVGLNSPRSSQFYPLDPECYQINYAIPPELILDSLPDTIVILEVYGRKCLLSDPRFQKQYHLRQKITTDIYGSDGMLILERNLP